MAKTKGHGNPPWTRDETILALDLYLNIDTGRLRSQDDRVAVLSRVLRQLPYHADAAKNETFRNAAGVAFKLQNIRQVATGKGLGNVSAMDRAIWAEFGDQEAEVRRLSALIMAGLKVDQVGEAVDPPDVQFYEGELLTQQHYKRERDRRVRKELLKSRFSNLRCEVCNDDFASLPSELRESVFEAHHVVPLSEAKGARITKLSEVALLCACCHRLLHRAIASRRVWLTPAALANSLNIS